MSNALLPDNREKQDTRHNPGDSAFDDLINRNYSPEEKQRLNDLSKGETSVEPGADASWNTNLSEEGSSNPKRRGFSKKSFIENRKKAVLISLSTLLIGGGGASLFFMGGALAPLSFFENVVDDLNDQLAALDERNMHLLRNKVSTADRRQALAGCTKMSIRCKFKTMSATQVKKYGLAGIRVVPDTSVRNIGNRVVPKEFEFRGKPMSPAEFANELKVNRELRLAFKRGLNMKYHGFSDRVFVDRVLKKFGLTKKPPELTGRTAEERARALMNRARVGSISEVKFIPADVDGNPLPEGTDSNHYIVEGDDGRTARDGRPRIFSASEVNDLNERTIGRVQNAAKPVTRLKANAALGLSVIGYADMACSIVNMIGMASVAAKVANSAELAQYVMPIASIYSKMKAGDATPEEVEALGTFFTQTDNRQEVVDVAGSFVDIDREASVFNINSNGAEPVHNDNLGTNVLDSDLYKMSAYGDVASVTDQSLHYSLGMSQSRLLAGYSNFADIARDISTIGGNADVCKPLQSWYVRGAGLIAGVVLAVGSGGSSLAVQGTVFAGMFAAMLTLDHIINASLSGSLLSEGMDEPPLQRGPAAWTGMAVLTSEASRTRGMIPGTAEDIIAYSNNLNESRQDYLAIESEGINAFDSTSTHSLIGSLSQSVYGFMSPTKNVASFVSNLSSWVSSSFGSIFKPITAKATGLDPSRFQQCDDDSYSDLNLGADVQCNLRYIMPPEDLARDPDEVAVYMEDNGYVEIDTATGLPEGYMPPDPQQNQNFAMDMLNGVASTFYESRNHSNDYSRFLDYCVYRALPYGETFEEGGAYGSASDDWLNGSKCLERSEMMGNFRAYTMDKSIIEALDEEALPIEEESANIINPIATPGEVSSYESLLADLKSRYENGKLPSSALCRAGSAWGTHRMHCEAQAKFVEMNEAFKKVFGSNIPINSSYRSYDAQVRMKALRGRFAATPGTSNHGWGLALDLGGGINRFGTRQHQWMRANAPKYGWNHPTWARQGGNLPEPWHWEYGTR